MKAKFGTVVSPFAVEKLTLGKDQKIVVGIISTTILITKTHFEDNIGSFHCFDGLCCKNNGIPSVRYNFPTYKYQSDAELNIVSDKIELWMLSVGMQDYQNLLTKNQILEKQDTNITRRDLLITCVEEQYQKKQYDLLGEAKWRSLCKKERYVEDMQKFVSRAEETLGRRFTPEAYTKASSENSATPLVGRQTIQEALVEKTEKRSGEEPVEVEVPTEDTELDADDLFDVDI